MSSLPNSGFILDLLTIVLLLIYLFSFMIFEVWTLVSDNCMGCGSVDFPFDSNLITVRI